MTKTGEKAEKCPCCNGIHIREIRTLTETITVEGKQSPITVSVSYCPFVSEYYETEEQFQENVKTLRRTATVLKEDKRYISQEKITELLLKLPPVCGEERPSNIIV